MPRTILFTGDSITDSGRREAGRSPLGSGYVALLAPELADAGLTVLNSGVAGDRIRDLRARWERDAAAWSPDVISILIGINDVWEPFRSGERTSAEDFDRDYRFLLEHEATRGARWVLLEPFLIGDDPEHERWATELREKQKVVQSLCLEYGAVFVPLHDVLGREAAARGASTITTDGIHLTPDGYACVAEQWSRHVDVRAL